MKRTGPRLTRASYFGFLALTFLALAILGPGLGGTAEAAGKKVALVIGNGSYRLHDPLPSARQDALAVTDSLRILGFDVIEANDANNGSIRAALNTFAERLGPDDLAVFYFMGYAVQVKERNFLLPLGAELRREFDLLTRGVALDAVRHLMEAAGTRANVIILDASYADRVSATQAWASAGLGETRPSAGKTLTVFSAAPGSELPPPDKQGSLFAREFRFVLSQPVVDLKDALRAVAGRVEVTSGAEQRPWLDPSFTRAIPLGEAPTGSIAVATPVPEPEPVEPEPTDPEPPLAEPSEADPVLSDEAPKESDESQTAALPEQPAETESEPEPAQLSPEELGKAFEASLSPADRGRIQRDLRTLELYRGGIDRRFGPGTRRGITSLQTRLGDPETGYLTVEQAGALAELAEERRGAQRAEQERQEAERKAEEARQQAAREEEARQAAAEKAKEQAAKAPQRPLSEVERVIKLAEEGDSRAQANLGVRYFHGRGVEQDYEKARFWYLKAAEQGETSAQTNLGFIYFNGYGVQRDLAEAAKWLRAAAEQGQREAQYNLGMLYENGSGVQRSYKEAAKWYGRAAERGIAEADRRIDYLKRNNLIE